MKDTHQKISDDAKEFIPPEKAPVERAEPGNTISLNAAKYDHLLALLNSPAITESMTAEERAQRTLYFNAYNRPETIGPTGCPYDSALYRSLTNPILTQAEIQLIIDATPDLERLLQLAFDFASGEGTLRDVHAARKMFEHIMEQSAQTGDHDMYLGAMRCLAEELALPMGPQNMAQALELFQSVIDICDEKDAATLGIDEVHWDIHYYWSLAGLAFCFEQMGNRDAADEAYERIAQSNPSITDRKDYVTRDFVRITNKARAMLDPRHEELIILASELDRLADRHRKIYNNSDSPMLQKIVGQADSFRKRAEILANQ